MTLEEKQLALMERQEQREKQKQLIAAFIVTPIFGFFLWVLYQIWH